MYFIFGNVLLVLCSLPHQCVTAHQRVREAGSRASPYVSGCVSGSRHDATSPPGSNDWLKCCVGT